MEALAHALVTCQLRDGAYCCVAYRAPLRLTVTTSLMEPCSEPRSSPVERGSFIGGSIFHRNRAVTSLAYGARRCPSQSGVLVEFRAVPRVQNAIAVLAVAAAIALLGLTLAVPRMSLLGTEPPFTYADAS
jgi:hypothetical protein